MSEHWLYMSARNTWTEAQRAQVKKGYEKYPTALGDSGLTAKQLMRHAVEENVDQMHYLTALGHALIRYEEALNAIMWRHDVNSEICKIASDALGKAKWTSPPETR